MNAIEVSKRAIDAWNRHDAETLIAVYAERATYHTPRRDHPLTGKAIVDFAKSVWEVYPDASLEVISRGDTGGGLVASQVVLNQIRGSSPGTLPDVLGQTDRGYSKLDAFVTPRSVYKR